MIRKLLLAVVGGLCLWAAFPGPALWFMAPVGVAVLTTATIGVRARHGFLLGLAGGLAFFLPVLHWTGIYVGALPWIALAITESLYLACMAAAVAVVQRDGRAHPFLVACLWVLQETVRSNVPFGGFPWARLAWSTAGSPLVHLASVAGAPGVTFVVALLGTFLASAACCVRLTLRDNGIRVVRPLLATGIVVALASIYPVPTGGRKLDVVGIQGNVPTAGLEFNAQRRAVLDNHVAATNLAATLVRQGRITQPDLVVWPENASDIDPTRNADAATEITRAVATINAPLIVGAVLEQPAPEVSNTSLLYLPGKGIVDRYVKQHPVPFAEYMPYRSFFRLFSDKVDLLTVDFAHGKKVGVFSVPTRLGAIKVGPVICFEIAYDSITRAPVTRGAGLLIVQTNNATFGHTAESEQQLAISRVRAVEHGRSVIHISTVGVSALITPDGEVHDKSALFTRKVLAGELPVRESLTFADRVGAWPELLIDVFAVGTIALTLVRRRRTNHAITSPAPKETDARV